MRALARSLRSLWHHRTLFDFQLEDVIEAIEGAAQRRAPCQLDDLRFREMFFQAGEDLVARMIPRICDCDGVLDDKLVDGIELRMIHILEQPRNTFSRDTL